MNFLIINAGLISSAFCKELTIFVTCAVKIIQIEHRLEFESINIWSN